VEVFFNAFSSLFSTLCINASPGVWSSQSYYGSFLKCVFFSAVIKLCGYCLISKNKNKEINPSEPVSLLVFLQASEVLISGFRSVLRRANFCQSCCLWWLVRYLPSW